MPLSEKQKKYQDYFKNKIKKYDADSPTDLSEEDRKRFFDDVDKGWESEEETSDLGEEIVITPGQISSSLLELELGAELVVLSDKN